jgi:3-oxoacyl-[acyl-carrier-protein] synthase I
MISLPITGISTVNAIGIGRDATAEGLYANRSGCQPCDYEDAVLNTHIGRVLGVEDTPLAAKFSSFECRNNRLANMAIEADGFESSVVRAIDQYGSDRIAIVLGTSSSGVREGEYAFANRDPNTEELPASFQFADTQSYHSLARFVQARLGITGPTITVSTACSSSAKAFVDAVQLIEAGICDAVVVGGSDSLCLLTLYGFDSLQLLAKSPCQPNDVNRAGISIGEGAGFALVERSNSKNAAIAHLIGYGESADAHHISATHPEGLGAELSMRAALKRANLSPNQIDYLNQHGTGTKQNDATEDAAITRVFGGGMRSSSTKGATGHTLGASGIIEAAICTMALSNSFFPGNINLNELDPTFCCRVTPDAQDGNLQHILSNSFGFGGNNCSLIFGTAKC